MVGAVSSYRDSKKEFKLAYCQKPVNAIVLPNKVVPKVYIQEPEEAFIN
jgi:hypothetical protein